MSNESNTDPKHGLRPFWLLVNDGFVVWAKSEDDAKAASEIVNKGEAPGVFERFEGGVPSVRSATVPDEMSRNALTFFDNGSGIRFEYAGKLKHEDRAAIVAAAKAIEEADASSAASPTPADVTLTEAFARVQAWQARTFGESSPMEARADKMVDEAREVAEAVAALVAAGIGNEANRKRVLAELGDVCFLVADLLRGLGAGTGELVSAILGNLAKNEQDDWKADATGKYSRVKPADHDDDGTIPWACDVCGEMGTKANGPEGYCADHWPKRHTPRSTHSTKD